jgi:4-amino-4-deoxy-L-arabinose transferase-like glycosyltransferase
MSGSETNSMKDRLEMRPTTNSASDFNVTTGRRFWALLCLLLAVSFAVRVAALAYWRTGAIENEGAEYARIAENLRNGVGYVGIATPGAELLFNPLYPLLIAGASFLTHDYESAARLVSLVLGAFLPLAAFGIASRLWNRHVGIAAALLTSFYPLLVNLSFTAFSEGPYATLLLSGIYLALRASDQPSIKPWFAVGAVFGLAYLTRAEAIAPFVIVVLFALVATEGGQGVRSKRALAAIAALLVLALPEIIQIYRATGRVRMDGKSSIFFAMGKRTMAAQKSARSDGQSSAGQIDVPSAAPNVESGEPWEMKWSNLAIDTNLNRTGVVMRPNADVIRETQISPQELVRLVAKGVAQNTPVFLQRLRSNWIGAPLLPALALLGIFRRPWRRPRASRQLLFLLIAGAPVAATLTFLWSDPRHYFVLLPFLLIWAANGLVEVGMWTKASSAALGWGRVAGPVVCRYAIPALVGFVMVAYPITGVRELYLFREGAYSRKAEKELGAWLGHRQVSPVRIMDIPITLAFHAGSQYVHSPYCTSDLALRFLDAAEVDYVVLRRGTPFTKYYEEWLTQGIPDPRAERLDLSPIAGAEEFVVYRWHRGG